jgi:hypothetical protein
MTRISSLLVASTLAILPISAFAQQTVAPAKTAEPTGMTTTAPATGSVTAKTDTTATTPKPEAKAATTPATKRDVKTPATGAKSEVHGMNTTTTGHAKTTVPAKPVAPAKS